MPLRTALIGLSSSATTSWASGAHLPALHTPKGRSVLPITALLNSSADAAKRAIQAYNLAPETKAYGSPEDLANDPDIDLVICNTRVDVHYETILPSVKKGKDVYVEWPVAGNLRDIDVLVKEAEKSGSRVAVGIQRRWAPQIVKLRELLADGKGKLGKVLSSDVKAFGGTNDREFVPPGLKYFTQREVGGHPINIGNAHCGFESALEQVLFTDICRSVGLRAFRTWRAQPVHYTRHSATPAPRCTRTRPGYEEYRRDCPLQCSRSVLSARHHRLDFRHIVLCLPSWTAFPRDAISCMDNQL